MRLTRLFTVVALAATATAVLAAPASANDADITPTPYVAPVVSVAPITDSIDVSTPVLDPLRSIRPLLYSDVDADYLASVGAVAIDTSGVQRILAATVYITRPSLAVKHVLDNNSSITSYCTYARSGVGVGGAGVDFTVFAEATAYGTYKGVEIVATGVECTLYKPDMTIPTGAMYAPGSVSVATAQRTSYDARGGYVCTKAYAVLRTIPQGESSAIKSTETSCFYV
ncbi:MAG TPA: hypothetical protein VGX28_17015 [Frankiaceae bacterium]|jgi:hypothetical protein|nr:hypothetical protein [Frankiaceae bacterium]